MQTDVIIIGGGIAGLTCGFELSRNGLAVMVLEKDHLLGGRARSWEDSATGDMVDIGPHILLTEYHNMLQLMRELGTHEQVLWQDDKFITLLSPPRPVDIKMHQLPAPLHFVPSLLAAPQLTLSDLISNKRLMWRVIRLRDSDIATLDKIGAEDYLRQQKVSEKMISWFWRSACMSIMNVPLDKCSAGALLRFFRFMVGKSGYKVGFAKTGLGELFGPAAAAGIKGAGGQVVTQLEVQAIAGSNTTMQSVVLTDGTEIRAKYCVAAIPPQALQPLLPDAWKHKAPFSRLTEFEPSPYVSVYLWFDRKLTKERFWARVWSPDNLNYDFYDLSNIRHGWTERPSVIASNIVYSHRTAGMTDADIIAATHQELAEYLPEAAEAELKHARVHHIPMAVPAPRPGIEQLRPKQATGIENFFLAGDWTQTDLPPSMESAVRSAYLTAEQILAREGCPRKIAVAPPTTEGFVRLFGSP